jgi:hypothetical protein
LNPTFDEEILMVLRVLKWGVMALLGYAAYEFIRGILEGEEAFDSGRASSPVARSGGLTGGGSGRIETTEDVVGTSAPHRVGRGIVRR